MIRTGYLICATPRSGSGLLSTSLTATGVLGEPDEYFSRAATHHNLGRWGIRDPSSTPQTPKAIQGADYLARVRAAATIDGVLGLTIHWYQYLCQRNLGLLTDMLEVFPPSVRASVKIVHLVRQDRLGQAISRVIADATRVYYIRRGEPVAVAQGYEDHLRAEPSYDTQVLDDIISMNDVDNQQWRSWITQRGLEHLTVYYEDLCGAYGRTVREVMNFLGAHPHVPVPPPQLVRQSSSLNEAFRQRYLLERTL